MCAGHVAPGEDAAVHLGMQGLHPPVEHLGKAGVVGDLGHLEAGVPQELGGAAGGDQRDAEAGEAAREFDDPGLVRDAEERLLDDGHEASER